MYIGASPFKARNVSSIILYKSLAASLEASGVSLLLE